MVARAAGRYLNRHADAGRCGLILSGPARTGKTTCLAQLGKTIETGIWFHWRLKNAFSRSRLAACRGG